MRPGSGWGSGSGKQLMLPPRLLGEKKLCFAQGQSRPRRPGYAGSRRALGFFFGTVPGQALLVPLSCPRALRIKLDKL